MVFYLIARVTGIVEVVEVVHLIAKVLSGPKMVKLKILNASCTIFME